MTTVVLDRTGRLVSFEAVPPQKDSSSPTSTPLDWAALFKLAGLDLATFHSVAPEWLPHGPADARQAWEDRCPKDRRRVRIEAAGWRGRPTYFQIIRPWTRPDRMEENAASRVPGAERDDRAATLVLLVCALLVSAPTCEPGAATGTGRFGSARWRVNGQLIAWAFNDPHVGDAVRRARTILRVDRRIPLCRRVAVRHAPRGRTGGATLLAPRRAGMEPPVAGSIPRCARRTRRARWPRDRRGSFT